MNILRTTLLALAAAGTLAAMAPAAQAHDRRGPRVGVYLGFGGPAWPGYWGPRSYWGPGPYWGPGYAMPYPPVVSVPLYPPVVIERAPEVYVERDAPAAPPPTATQWWYWCGSANAYYPYVKSCAEGWQKVPPQPSN